MCISVSHILCIIFESLVLFFFTAKWKKKHGEIWRETFFFFIKYTYDYTKNGSSMTHILCTGIFVYSFCLHIRADEFRVKYVFFFFFIISLLLLFIISFFCNWIQKATIFTVESIVYWAHCQPNEMDGEKWNNVHTTNNEKNVSYSTFSKWFYN